MRRVIRFTYIPTSGKWVRALYHRPNSWTRYQNVGLLLNRRAFWVGWHYSEHNRRLCINVLPCITIYYVRPEGFIP